MKLRFSDCLLIACWTFFITFAGPFLVSARDWLLVIVGGVLLGALAYWTHRAFVHHTEKKVNA